MNDRCYRLEFRAKKGRDWITAYGCWESLADAQAEIAARREADHPYVFRIVAYERVEPKRRGRK